MPQRLLDIILGCLLAPKKDDKPAACKCAPRHTPHGARGSVQVAGSHMLHLTAASEHRAQQRSFGAAGCCHYGPAETHHTICVWPGFLRTSDSVLCGAQAGAGADPPQRGAAAAVAAALPDRGHGRAAHRERAAGGLPPPHLPGTHSRKTCFRSAEAALYVLRGERHAAKDNADATIL